MTSLYDGNAGALNDLFGAPVELWRAGAKIADLRGHLRSRPIEVVTADGRSQTVTSPVLRVPQTAATLPQRADVVRQGGKSWRVLDVYPSGSPAADAFLICDLEPVP